MRPAWLLTALLAALAGPALARPCAPADVAGLWELQSITADEPGVEAFYKQAPWEYVEITPAMNFAYVAGKRQLAVKDAEAALDAARQAGGVLYTVAFPEPGRLIVLRDAQTPEQGFSCDIAEAASETFGVAVGDMVWTELPGAPRLRRVHRRIKAPPAAPFLLLGMSKPNMQLIDTRTVWRSGDDAAFELIVVPGKPVAGQGGLIDRHVLVLEARCPTRSYRAVRVDGFDAAGRRLQTRSEESAWSTAADGPIAEAVAVACDGKPTLKETIALPGLEQSVSAYRTFVEAGKLD